MLYSRLITACLAAKLSMGYLVTPSGTPYPGAVSDCSGWVEGTSGVTCAQVEEAVGITAEDFTTWNPLVAETSTCELAAGFWYCIQVDFGSASSTTTTQASTTTTVASTSTGDGVSTPTPIQTGMISTCNGFWLVSSGDTCDVIVSLAGIPLATFYAWNPAVGTDCTDLEVGENVCIGIIGYTPSATTTTATSTSTGDGISTPSPIQTGMISTCDKFYLVASGDTCAAVATAAGVSLTTFYAWNPAVGSSCADLEVGEYVCIDIIGSTTTAVTTTTTATGDAISTPSPVQTGIVSTCNEFYLVVSGDTCAAVSTAAGISLTTFYAWNPAVGTSCAYLEVGDYVCIDIIGYSPSSTTLSTSTTTSSGNGVTTPTPYETGMVSDCDTFHLVSSGDTCTSIASSYGITVADIQSWNLDVGSSCTSIWLDYYICVGVL